MANSTFTAKAWEHYIYWQVQDKKTLKKINSLLESIDRDGAMQGIGKPELLKHDKSGLSQGVSSSPIFSNPIFS